MTVVDLALIVGETSLRASLVLIVVLTTSRALANRTEAGVRRALLLTAVLTIPALPLISALLPDLTLSALSGTALPRIATASATGGLQPQLG